MSGTTDQQDNKESCCHVKVMKAADLIANLKLCFSGNPNESPEEFLFRLKAVKRCAGLNYSEFQNVVPLALKGRAATWFQIDESRMNTFEQFLNLFSLNFEKEKNMEMMFAKAVNRKQGENEPTISYLQDLQVLLHANPNMPNMHMTVAIENLKPEYRTAIYYQRTEEQVLERFKTMDDLKEVAKKWDSSFKDGR